MLIGRRSFLTAVSSSALSPISADAQPSPNARQQKERSEFDLVRDFGAVGDGMFDNAAALKSFNEAAKKESNAGHYVVLNVPPGLYNFNHSRCLGFLMGIKNLTIIGPGAIFQNTYNPATAYPSFAFEQAWGIAGGGGRLDEPGKEIDTLVAGISTIQLKSPDDSTGFAVGDWILIGSLDIQYYGFPPNLHYFEYVEISKIDHKTGAITIVQKVRWPHRDDFPDNNKHYGKARIWNMKSKDNIPWDVRHVYHGLEIRSVPNSTATYITAIGMSITYENCILPGLSQTIANRVVMRGGMLTADSEPDKLVDQCVYDAVNIKRGLVFQSSSINSASLRDCYVNGVLMIGQVKHFHAQNCDIQWLAEGGIYGLNLATSLEDCLVHRMDSPIRNYGPLNIVTKVDGDKVTFSKGKFTIARAFKYLAYWNAVPGAAVNLRANGKVSGQLGTGYITSITGDDTHVYWETTLPYETLPDWADGAVEIQKAGRIRMVNCSGCSVVEAASSAASAGKEPWEQREILFLGVTDQTGFLTGYDGILTKATINVIQPGRTPGAQLIFTQYGAVTANGMSDPQSYIIGIDVSNRGLREFSTQELRGQRGKDFVKLATKELVKLDDNRHCTNMLNWSLVGYKPSEFAASELPIVAVTLQFDSGLYRNGIPMVIDQSGKFIAGISGRALKSK